MFSTRSRLPHWGYSLLPTSKCSSFAYCSFECGEGLKGTQGKTNVYAWTPSLSTISWWIPVRNEAFASLRYTSLRANQPTTCQSLVTSPRSRSKIRDLDQPIDLQVRLQIETGWFHEFRCPSNRLAAAAQEQRGSHPFWIWHQQGYNLARSGRDNAANRSDGEPRFALSHFG